MKSDSKMMAFYTPAQGNLVPQIVDVAIETDGEWVGRFSGKRLDAIREKYPTAQLGSMDDIIEIKEAMARTAPMPISADDFEAARCTVPPEDEQEDERGNTFKSSEHLSGSMTAIYARVGDAYFTFTDVCTLTHSEILAKVRAEILDQASRMELLRDALAATLPWLERLGDFIGSGSPQDPMGRCNTISNAKSALEVTQGRDAKQTTATEAKTKLRVCGDYAHITTAAGSDLSVLLDNRANVGASLRASAAEIRAKALRDLQRADTMIEASFLA